MIGSYEREEFHPTLDSINKLGVILDVNILCSEGYSKFLLESYKFKDKLVIWRYENNLTKRAASKLLSISEKGYSLWEDGILMNVTTYIKVKDKLLKYSLI